MDIVFVVRDGANAELRYALRSLANVPHDNVWIIGHKPSWVTGIRYVPTVQRGSKYENVWHNWVVACDTADISDEFIYFNDDYFIVEPIDQVPVLHHGPLAEHAEAMRLTSFADAMRRTVELLAERGISDPLSYEFHAPMVVTKTGFADALKLCTSDSRLFPRSIFGNLLGIGGAFTPDVKVRNSGDPFPAGPFVSTADVSWLGTSAGRIIRALFPQPGPYEVAS